MRKRLRYLLDVLASWSPLRRAATRRAATAVTAGAQAAARVRTAAMCPTPPDLLHALGMTELRVIAALTGRTARTVGDICRTTGLPPVTVQACLDALIASGRATRVTAPVAGVAQLERYGLLAGGHPRPPAPGEPTITRCRWSPATGRWQHYAGPTAGKLLHDRACYDDGCPHRQGLPAPRRHRPGVRDA